MHASGAGEMYFVCRSGSDLRRDRHEPRTVIQRRTNTRNGGRTEVSVHNSVRSSTEFIFNQNAI